MLKVFSKTQVALEFAYRLHDQANSDIPPSIYWLHASSQSRLEEGLKRIERNFCEVMKREAKNPLPFFVIGEEEAEDALSLTKEWLESPYSKTWLLVIDNADDEDVFFSSMDPPKTQRHHAYPSRTPLERTSGRRLCDYIPRKAGCAILYTSRHRNCVQHLLSRSQSNTLIQVYPLNVTESAAMLNDELGRFLGEQRLEEVRLSTEKLAKTLDGLPLAITQATVPTEAPTIPLANKNRPVGQPTDLLVIRPAHCSAYVRLHCLVNGLSHWATGHLVRQQAGQWMNAQDLRMPPCNSFGNMHRGLQRPVRVP
jgi:hypothetical protein